MKFNVLTFALLYFAAPAFANDTVKPAPMPTCGKTVEECQKVIDDLAAKDAAALAMSRKQTSAYKELLAEANDRLVGAVAK